MAIAPKPKRHTNDIASKSTDAAAEAFIRGADPAPSSSAARRNKKPVLVRFDDDMLAAIDRKAKSMGLGRSAWVRMVVSRALQEGE